MDKTELMWVKIALQKNCKNLECSKESSLDCQGQICVRIEISSVLVQKMLMGTISLFETSQKLPTEQMILKIAGITYY